MSPVVRTLRPVAMLIRLVVPPLILAVGLWAGWMLFSSKAAPELVPVDESAVVVRVVEPPLVETSLDVTAWGTVTPSRKLTLRPEVSGRLLEVDSAFVPGGVFAVGDSIAKIDDRDYVLLLRQAESSLATARFNLELEEGRGRVAQRDWELLGDEVASGDAGSRMALRKPHLAEKQAAVESAESRLGQAQLAVDRTVVTAPFNAMVLNESAEVGEMVSASSALGTLVGTDEYWVEIGIPLDDVASLDLGSGGSDERSAVVSLATGGGEAATYEGRVAGLTGSVDPVGRLARVLVTVPNPLSQSQARSVPLLIGSYVQVQLEGPRISGVRSLPRSAVREGDRVWIVGADDRLIFRAIEIMSGDAASVFARVELATGEAVVTSPIPAAAPGKLLQREQQQ